MLWTFCYVGSEIATFYGHFTTLGVKSGTFSDFFMKKEGNSGLNKEPKPSPKPGYITCSYITYTSQTSELELRPSEPPSSTAVQPSPAVT